MHHINTNEMGEMFNQKKQILQKMMDNSVESEKWI